MSRVAHRRARAARRRPAPESLESRRLMAVFTVNSTADILSPPAGVVTLRSAIEAADASPGADTIDIPQAGTYKVTTLGTSTDNSAGEFDIADAGDLTIQNTSGGAVTIDGGGLNRVFDINPAVSSTLFTVSLEGLFITDGVASGSSPNGGGIDAHGGAGVLLEATSLVGDSAAGNGGGIDMEADDDAGLSILFGGQISSDRSLGNGGGIAASSTGSGVAISPGTVIDDDIAGGYGGGIYLGHPQLNATGVIIRHDTAQSSSGGGIANLGAGSIFLTGDLIENDSAPGDGGGVASFVASTPLTLTRCFVLDNTANIEGGGAYTDNGYVTATDTTFSGNHAQLNGGGFYVAGVNTSATLAGSDVIGNTAAGDGGGIGAEQNVELTVTGSTVGNNLAFNSGGGIALVDSSTDDVVIENTLFRGNTALSKGGGLYDDGGGTVDVTTSRFTGNNASYGGAASVVVLSNLGASTLDANRASIAGGALDLELTNSSTALGDDTIAANASGDRDGAVTMAGSNTSDLVLVSDTIDGNTASMADSGGFDMVTGKLDVFDTIFAGNVAVTSPSDFLYAGGTVNDDGGNLVESPNGTGAKFKPATIFADPKLGPLADNGGLRAGSPSDSQVIPTQALLPGSPAIGKGASGGALTAVDQRDFHRPAAGRTNPSIGAYEPQYASNATPNQVFAEDVYEVLLNRVADPGGLAAAVNFLNAGGSPTALIQSFQGSAEYDTDQIILTVQRYLGRTPSVAEVNGILPYLEAGHTPEQLGAIFVGSDEFYQDYGSISDMFVLASYQSVLGRAAAPSEVAAWDQALANGLSRPSAATIFLSSQEYLTDLIQSDFAADYGRAAQPSDVATFLKAAAMGATTPFFQAVTLAASFGPRT